MNSIKLFESKKIRSVWIDSEQKWYFSVQDVVEILTESLNVKDYIKKLRKRDPQLNLYWGTNCPLVEMPTPDGKIRKIQAANAAGLFRLIQSVPSPKAEPFKRWLGEASTTELVKSKHPEGFIENKNTAKEGGEIAGNARKALEKKTGKKVVNKQNYLPAKKPK